MKICIINNLYPPHVRGGAEQVVVKTVEGLIATGHEVVVVTTAPQGDYTEQSDRLTIYRYRPANVFFYTEAKEHGIFLRLLWHIIDIFHVPSMRYVERILQVEKPDVVHTHNLMGVSFLIPRMIRRLGIRHVHTVHDVQLVEPSGIIRKQKERSWRYTGFPIKLYSALMRGLFGSPDVVISPSQFLLKFYELRRFFPDSKRIVLRNPVTTDVTPVERTPHGIVHFLYLGQVEEHKGVFFLVKTFLAFASRYPRKAFLHIAGTGSEIERIRQTVGKTDAILLHGKVDHGALAIFFGNTDMTIVPSLCYENSPTVIFESFSFGVPVLASNVEGIAELIADGENGYTFTTGDEASLFQKLVWCIEHRESLAEMNKTVHASPLGLRPEEYIERLQTLYRV